jgi:E3 SUMO-protein ligase PIAS1
MLRRQVVGRKQRGPPTMALPVLQQGAILYRSDRGWVSRPSEKSRPLLTSRFFLSILQAVPEAIEEVILEPDGEWHSEDNKYGSPAWLATRSAPVAEPEAKPVITGKTNGYSARELSPSTSPVPQAAGSDSKGKRKAIEILSSDDEDGPLARPGTIFSLPPSLRPSAQPRGSSSSRPSAAPNDQSVIDLTLSDSDDDVAGPSNRGGAGGGEADFRSPGAGLTGRSAAGAASRPPPARNSFDRNGQNGELDPSVRDRSGGMNGGGYGGAGGSHLAAQFYSHDDGLAMGSYRDGVDAFDAWDDGEAGPGAESRYRT